MSLHGFEMELSEKDAEIERLKSEMTSAIAVMASVGITIEGKNVLIIELAAAYAATRGDGDITKKLELLKRAREATKDELGSEKTP